MNDHPAPRSHDDLIRRTARTVDVQMQMTPITATVKLAASKSNLEKLDAQIISCNPANAAGGFMKAVRLFLAPTLALGLWLPQAHAQVSRTTAQQVVAESGLSEQLKLMPLQVRAGMAEVAPALGVPNELLTRMQHSADRAFAPARLNDLVVAAVARELNPTHALEALRWLRSADGRRVISLELIATTQSTELQSWLTKGNAAYAVATLQRRALLDAVEQTLRAADQMAEVQLQTITALLRGVASAMPPQQVSELAPVLAQLQRQRPQMEAAARGIVLASFASTYAPLSDAELGLYVDFLRSPTGQHTNRVVFQAFSAAMTAASEAMGRALPALPATQKMERLNS
jgi:hypothetical protein